MGHLPRLLHWVTLWLALTLLGVLPAAVVLVASRDPVPQPWPLLRAEARGCARTLDAYLERWKGRASTLALELTAILSQLTAGQVGKAAEATLQHHLQRRLSQDREMSQYLVLDPKGQPMFSTAPEVKEALKAVIPQMAQAAQRPAVALIRSTLGKTELVIGAPIFVGSTLRGVFVGRIRVEASRRLCQPSSTGVTVDLIDASGHSLLYPTADQALLALGSASSPGVKWLGGVPVSYEPLLGMRAVVAASGQSSNPAPPVAWRHVMGVVVIALVAGLLTWVARRIFARS